MELIEVKKKQELEREAAAEWLRTLADQLARHNNLEFEREGLRYRVAVPKQVKMETEIEVESDGGSLEIEISW